MTNSSAIRNFCVISHIDHGKTTLTDRFLEYAGLITSSQQRFLDSNPIEKERGITIKLAPVRFDFSIENQTYTLNLIDTPGHVDFGYEVSRSLAACEGAVLLVDATKGIQAQTMVNAHKAIDHHLTIIPVVNKIDLPQAQPEKTAQELIDTFGFLDQEILFISAKTGQGVIQLIKQIINRLPAPQGSAQKPLKALVFNSFYHSHLGVIASVRLFEGQIKPDDQLFLIATKTDFQPKQIGIFTPQLKPVSLLTAGEVGFTATGLKDISLCRVGDTLTLKSRPLNFKPLPGYQTPKPMVFMDFYPTNNQDFPQFKTSIEKLKLVDASLSFKPVGSPLLGSGFRIGFQGLLHADIVQERLEREFDLQLISTSPSVEYQIYLKNNQTITIQNPSQLPDHNSINQIREPFIQALIYTPDSYLSSIIKLCQSSRGVLIDQKHYGNQVKLVYHLPLIELISGFFDQLKSSSSGYASLEWHFLDYRSSDIVKLTVYLNRQPIEPLSSLVIRQKAQTKAFNLAKKLKTILPRQQFELPIQIGINQKILARETVKAVRKDVTAKLYGGDQTRKDKLLKKQKKGKQRLKQIGQLSIPQEAFLAILKS